MSQTHALRYFSGNYKFERLLGAPPEVSIWRLAEFNSSIRKLSYRHQEKAVLGGSVFEVGVFVMLFSVSNQVQLSIIGFIIGVTMVAIGANLLVKHLSHRTFRVLLTVFNITEMVSRWTALILAIFVEIIVIVLAYYLFTTRFGESLGVPVVASATFALLFCYLAKEMRGPLLSITGKFSLSYARLELLSQLLCCIGLCFLIFVVMDNSIYHNQPSNAPNIAPWIIPILSAIMGIYVARYANLSRVKSELLGHVDSALTEVFPLTGIRDGDSVDLLQTNVIEKLLRLSSAMAYSEKGPWRPVEPWSRQIIEAFVWRLGVGPTAGSRIDKQALRNLTRYLYELRSSLLDNPVSHIQEDIFESVRRWDRVRRRRVHP
jgi:hypothetical protein